MRPEFVSPAAILFLLSLVIATIVSVPLPAAAVCAKWSEAKKAGTLDYLRIDEASGVAVSAKFPGRLYHINDSGGGPYFYITNMDGGNTRRPSRIEGYDSKRLDFEDMSAVSAAPANPPYSSLTSVTTGREGTTPRSQLRRGAGGFRGTVKPFKDNRYRTAPTPRARRLCPRTTSFILTKEEKRDYADAYPAKSQGCPGTNGRTQATAL
ncbi:MAG: hypothetical protein R3B51_11955 [Thermodesulfobacteriota bacterium]